MGTKKRDVLDMIDSDRHVSVATNADRHFVRLQATGCVDIDAAGVGQLVGALTQWLADRADRL